MLHRALAIITLLIVFGISAALLLKPALPTDDERGAAIGGPFTLSDQFGKTRHDTDFHGRWMLVYFGFTHCPDICPLGLSTLTDALNQLGPEGDQVQPIFVTLDPERDSAEALKPYLAEFSPRWVGLTGSAGQIRDIASAYKVYYARENTPDSALGYTINHSGFVYLIGPDGSYRTHFRHDDSARTIADGIRTRLAAH